MAGTWVKSLLIIIGSIEELPHRLENNGTRCTAGEGEPIGISLHRIRMGDAIDLLLHWMGEGLPCRYVVTPNVDHIVKLQSFPAMQAAYRDASLVVADGWPLVAASRWLRQPLPERVAGSDLVPGLFTAGKAIPGFRVFLLGGSRGWPTRPPSELPDVGRM